MQKPRKIDVLLFPDFSNHCLANAVEPLRAANTLARKPLYSWRFLSLDGAEVRSSSGLPVRPEGRLAEQAGGDYLFIMPSYGHHAHAGPATTRALRAAAGRYGTLVGLDTGSWLMAEAGLLDGRRATIHWDEITAFSERFPEVSVHETRFIIDGNRITCGGASTTFELMLELISTHHGPMLRLEVAALFMHGEAGPDPMRELRLATHHVVEAAAALMRRNIEAPLPIAEIARHLGLSQRSLEHHFARHVGQSPRRIYAALRLREARRLVERTRLSVAEIATRAGYENAAAMTRAFKAEFGVTPSMVRAG